MEMQLRKAHIEDVKTIHGLLMQAAGDGLVLPRSLSQLYGHVREFYVMAGQDGTILGCSALSIMWSDLAEVRSLVVAPSQRRLGLGKKLVEACLEEARSLGISRVFALTYQVDFFCDSGFEVVSKDVLPQKVWTDCINCPKFPDCDEVAVLRSV